jgi:hypothetical protein
MSNLKRCDICKKIMKTEPGLHIKNFKTSFIHKPFDLGVNISFAPWVPHMEGTIKDVCNKCKFKLVNRLIKEWGNDN